MVARGDVAPAADLAAGGMPGPPAGSAGGRVGRDVSQLPDAGELGMHEPLRAFADMAGAHATCACDVCCHAVNCGCIGVWHVWPQNFGDSIQWRAP